MSEEKRQIRTLFADEIECRVGTINEKGCTLLLYKDARVDMRLLDEFFGPTNWKRSHELINGNLFCTVSIWDNEKKEWVSKQDVGTESNTEKEKGQASDAFKRACFNWGIGRELYSAPFIWIKLEAAELVRNNIGKPSTRTKFAVKEIKYNAKKEISKLVIVDDKGAVRYTMGSKVTQPAEKQPEELKPATGNPIPEGMYTGAQLRQAIEMMNSCRNRDEVNNVWTQFKAMQKNSEFAEACKNMCKKYPKK